MTTQKLLTVTISTGETVLAKSSTEPLRYGNLSAAQKKLDLIETLLSPSRFASIVKQDGRFLIFIYNTAKPTKFPLETSLVKLGFENLGGGSFAIPIATLQRPRPSFATTSGQRLNPKNRHNHAHKDQTDKPYYFGG